MSKDIEKDFNLGGSVERALSGDYELKAGDVLKEAWQHTMKNFLSFSPAIVALIVLQLGIFYIALKLQLGNPGVIFDAITNPEGFDPSIFNAIMVANFSYEVISAPIYAGISLMAMSHAAGLQTKPRHIGKGLQYTVPVIIATLMSLVLQGLAGMIFPFLSLYLSLAFTNSILLICEKQVSPLQSLWLSLRAVNKKFFVLAGIYSLLSVMFVAGVMFYGLGLIIVLPFFFHVKGVIYRNMFGIKLKVVASNKTKNDQDDDNDPQVFNA
ncbi:membrane protein [Vibrio tubiashii]|nr:membrane protein [Vibrio tubiashii]